MWSSLAFEFVPLVLEGPFLSGSPVDLLDRVVFPAHRAVRCARERSASVAPCPQVTLSHYNISKIQCFHIFPRWRSIAFQGLLHCKGPSMDGRALGWPWARVDGPKPLSLVWGVLEVCPGVPVTQVPRAPG